MEFATCQTCYLPVTEFNAQGVAKCPNCGSLVQKPSYLTSSASPTAQSTDKPQAQLFPQAAPQWQIPQSQNLPGQSSQKAAPQATGTSAKRQSTTLYLTVLLGYLGIHRFYVGKVGTGFIWLFTGGGFVIGWLLDIYMARQGTFTDAQGKLINDGISAGTEWWIKIDSKYFVMFGIFAGLMMNSVLPAIASMIYASLLTAQSM